MARIFKRRNPMPMTGAVFVTNPRRTKKRSALASVIAKLNRAGSRRSNGSRMARRRNTYVKLYNRRRNHVAIQTNGKRRRNHIAIRTNKRRRNHVAIQTNPRRARRNGYVKLYNRRRKNGLALRNPRRHNRSHARRTNRKSRRHNGRRHNGYVKLYNRGRGKGRRHNKSRRNPYVKLYNRRRRNSGGVKVQALFAPVQKIVAKIPVVGKYVAPYIGPVVLSVVGLYAVHTALGFGAKYIPVQLQPIGYTLGGLALAALVAFLPIDTKTKAQLGVALVGGGGAVDAFRYISGSSALGDGGAYQIAALGAPDPGNLSAHDPAALQASAAYRDAQPADAMACGPDFDDFEGQALLSGPMTWFHQFPMNVRAARVAQGPGSRHAGQHGHRWGWLIAMIGFDRVKQLAALPVDQRVAYIAQLRQHAVDSANAAIQSAGQPMIASSVPDQQATHGLGALLYAGS